MTRRTRPWRELVAEQEAKRERNARNQTVAYRLVILDEHTVRCVLISAIGMESDTSLCACVRQAIELATRFGTRPLEYRGMTGWLPGLTGFDNPLRFEDLPECTITDPDHAHVHNATLPEEPHDHA